MVLPYLGLALLCGAAAAAIGNAMVANALLAGATAFFTSAVILGGGLLWRRQSARLEMTVLSQLANDAIMPMLVTDPQLRVVFANTALVDRFGEAVGVPVTTVLGRGLSSVDELVLRLMEQSEGTGSAHEDLAGHSGRFRLSTRRLGGGRHVWRLETIGAASLPEPLQEHNERPTLTVGRSGAVLFMNAAARGIFGRRVKRLEEALTDPPLRPGAEHSFNTPGGVRKFVASVNDAGVGRQEVVLKPVEDDEDGTADARSGFDDLPVPLLRLSPDGTILRANGVACQMLDVTSADGRNVAEFMEGLGRAISGWLAEAVAGRGLHRSEFLRLSRQDREVYVQVTLNRVRTGDSAELVAVLNDATELKTLEAQFVQSQKMQAIGQLAGGVAHDFNNLLTAISGHCDLLLLRHDHGDPDYADLVQINQNANRAAGLVGQLLAFSRKQTLRPEVLDLRDTLSDLTHLLNRLVGEKVQLELSHDPVLPAIRGDRRQLEQVMMNLVVNARDAMQDGGRIQIETERRVLTEPLKRDRAVVEAGEYVTVKVTDCGMGIPKDKLQKVFEPFYTSKRTGEGTGLGLSTVYGIVKQTGGFIFVDSEVGQGSTFTLLFPAFEVPANVAPVSKQAAARIMPKNGTGVVLLVEDEAPVRAFAARALRMRGYSVLEAGTGEEALDKLEDRDVKVDIFVTDVIMPGMDGPTWVREALKERAGTRVVFVSGYAEDIFVEGAEKVPNSVFLPKPFSLSELTETVHQQLN
ncbi:hybrid sensor histidine kinase/response regulator [Salipiger pallidus]|uniref:histidine kinase n=1 Tax=Salipiger pallidus TaxID=1775170 RepID=A0A8J2ZKG3_9RHOB|nr:hybrid sensor histidine kinase/response regulator [Salipiger pallidus]